MKRTVKIVSVGEARSFATKTGEQINVFPIEVKWEEGVQNSDSVQEYSLVVDVRGNLDVQKLAQYVGTNYTLDVHIFFDTRVTKDGRKFNQVSGYLPKELYMN